MWNKKKLNFIKIFIQRVNSIENIQYFLVCHDQLGIESLATKLISGLGSGETEVIFTDNNVIHANMYRGVINGLVRKLR